jgi:hypothetical protein
MASASLEYSVDLAFFYRPCDCNQLRTESEIKRKRIAGPGALNKIAWLSQNRRT